MPLKIKGQCLSHFVLGASAVDRVLISLSVFPFHVLHWDGPVLHSPCAFSSQKRINKQREMIGLERQGAQQQRPEWPPVTAHPIRENSPIEIVQLILATVSKGVVQ